MRTDAKIGFAIGGVLLAVIVVYLLVVPRHRQAAHPAVVLVTPGGSAGSQASEPSDNSASENTTFSNSTGGDKGSPFSPSVAPPMISNLPSSGGAADTTAGVPGPVASTGAKGDGSNWEKLFAGSTQLPAASTADSQRPIAGATPLTPTGGVAARSAGAALNGGTSTAGGVASLGSDRASDRGSAAGSPRPYVIKQGQTLSSIAADVYGNSRFYVAILKANPAINPNRLRPGTPIVLPDISDVKPSGGSVASADSGANQPGSLDAGEAAGGGVILASEAAPLTEVVASGRVYAVQRGDTLYRISKRIYGTTAEAKIIYSLNQDTIGPNAAKLKLGMILHLPDRAAG